MGKSYKCPQCGCSGIIKGFINSIRICQNCPGVKNGHLNCPRCKSDELKAGKRTGELECPRCEVRFIPIETDNGDYKFRLTYYKNGWNRSPSRTFTGNDRSKLHFKQDFGRERD